MIDWDEMYRADIKKYEPGMWQEIEWFEAERVFPQSLAQIGTKADLAMGTEQEVEYTLRKRWCYGWPFTNNRLINGIPPSEQI